MRTKCRMGDLALIINDEPGCEANLGRFVRVCSLPAFFDDRFGLMIWQILPITDTPITSICEATGEVKPSTWGIMHPDAWLMPIKKPRVRKSRSATTEPEGQR
jgi:hypothetical protein